MTPEDDRVLEAMFKLIGVAVTIALTSENKNTPLCKATQEFQKALGVKIKLKGKKSLDIRMVKLKRKKQK